MKKKIMCSLIILILILLIYALYYFYFPVKKAVDIKDIDFNKGYFLCETVDVTNSNWYLISSLKVKKKSILTKNNEITGEFIELKGKRPEKEISDYLNRSHNFYVFKGRFLNEQTELENLKVLWVDEWYIVKPIDRGQYFLDGIIPLPKNWLIKPDMK